MENLSIFFYDQKLRLVPTRNSLADSITEAIISLSIGIFRPWREQIRNAVLKSVEFLPTSPPKLKDVLPDLTVDIRRAIADTLWKELVDSQLPTGTAYRLLVNSMYEGGLAEGDVFRRTMQKLLGLKIHGDANKIVKFKDLPLELAVVATHTHSIQMEVYSRRTGNGEMDVAEAVRRSMSIPLFFEPCLDHGHEIMDGGISSNFPYWLFSSAGDAYFENASDPTNRQRIKLGFFLSDHKNTSPQWRVRTPPFKTPSGQPKKPGTLEGLIANDNQDLARLFGGDILKEIVGIERFLRLMETMDERERNLHNAAVETVMQGLNYSEIEIPLRGYSWLDFSVNTSVSAFCGMAERGWHATIDLLERAGIIVDIERTNPYL